MKELESELARVRSDLDSAGQQEHNMNEEEQTIAEELAQSDTNVRSLRSQMDQLTQEIKQANLQSLSIAPADDLKILLEGKQKINFFSVLVFNKDERKLTMTFLLSFLLSFAFLLRLLANKVACLKSVSLRDGHRTQCCRPFVVITKRDLKK